MLICMKNIDKKIQKQISYIISIFQFCFLWAILLSKSGESPQDKKHLSLFSMYFM